VKTFFLGDTKNLPECSKQNNSKCLCSPKKRSSLNIPLFSRRISVFTKRKVFIFRFARIFSNLPGMFQICSDNFQGGGGAHAPLSYDCAHFLQGNESEKCFYKKKYCNKLTKIKALTKKSYYKDQFSRHRSDPRKT